MKSAEKPATNVVPMPRRPPRLRRDEMEFLPAALEIIETPAPPLGRAIAGTLIAFFLIAVAWACFGHIDIIATAQGKIVPFGRVKVIQPLDTGNVVAIRVRDHARVREGDVLIELDRTVSTAERNRIGHELLRARLNVARLTALRAGLATAAAIGFVPPAGAPAYEVARTHAAMTAQAEQHAAKSPRSISRSPRSSPRPTRSQRRSPSSRPACRSSSRRRRCARS